jgi:hypothetical protein
MKKIILLVCILTAFAHATEGCPEGSLSIASFNDPGSTGLTVFDENNSNNEKFTKYFIGKRRIFVHFKKDFKLYAGEFTRYKNRPEFYQADTLFGKTIRENRYIYSKTFLLSSHMHSKMMINEADNNQFYIINAVDETPVTSFEYSQKSYEVKLNLKEHPKLRAIVLERDYSSSNFESVTSGKFEVCVRD